MRREAWYVENGILKCVEEGLGWEAVLEVRVWGKLLANEPGT
jgi:hypothetical protein